MADSKTDAAKIEKLNGTNYLTWKYNMKLILMERGLWGFIDGRETKPTDGDKESVKKLYCSNSDKAYSLIALGVEKSLQIHVVNTTHPKEAWEILQSQFSFVSVTQIVRLNRKFYAATMQESDDLMEHITLMTSYAQQLRDLNEVITPQKFATVMLGTLPTSYDTFITSLNARKADELDWDSLKGSLIEEYLKRKEKSGGTSQKDDALIMSGGQRNTQRYQPRYGDNNVPAGRYGSSSGSGGGTPLTCFRCGDLGHIARNCSSSSSNNGRNNNTNMNVNPNNNNHNYHNSNNPNNYGRRNMNINNNNRQSHYSLNNNNNRRGEQGNFSNSFYQLSIDDDFALATTNFDSNSTDHEWFIDSAASKHMTFDQNAMIDFIPYQTPTEIFLGDNAVILAMGEGTVKLPIFKDNNSVTCLTLHNVLYVPDIRKSLISVPAMAHMGAEIYFDNKKCIVSKDGKCLTIGHIIQGKLYRLNNKQEYASFANTSSSAELWHRRLGHLNYDYIEQLSKGNLVTGMDKHITKKEVKHCEPCILGKMHKSPFPKQSQTKSTQVLELVHTDLCGPMEIESKGGSKYVLTIIDDFSRYTTVYFLRSKDEVLGKFKEYVLQMENSTGHKLKTVRSDNGGEYTSNEFLAYCKQMTGIHHEFTNPYTPEQNGVAERYNRTVMEAARSMLSQSKLPLSFWAEAVKCATYVRNRSPTTALDNKTPFELWYGRKPDVSNLRVFGCVSYVHVPDEQRKKLQPKSQRCVFTGYPDDTKGFKLFNLETSRFIRSRSVLFCEDEFQDFNTKVEPSQWITLFPINNQQVCDVDVLSNDVQEEVDDNTNVEPDVNINPLIPNVTNADILNDETEVNNTQTYEGKFLDEVHNLNQKRKKNLPKRYIAEASNYTAEQCLLTESLVADIDEPKSVQAAMEDGNWHAAMQSEMLSLHKNDTWELVPRPVNKNIVGSRWVFKIKRNPDGTIERYKARLVAQGFSQVHGLDYSEVFSPVVRYAGIRSLLAYANINDLETHQMDVKTAFLNGELDHEIFMEQPKGFVDEMNPTYVCRLKKSLYGLKQSARCWNTTLTQHLLSDGYKKCSADECIFIKTVDKNFVILAIYVDDVIPISNDISMLEKEKVKLQKKFEMVDNGPVHYILGMSIKRDRKNKVLTISQPNYLNNILKRFGMESCNPVATPLEMGKKFRKTSENDKQFNITLYQQAIGCLTYAALTARPDIAAATGTFAQYMSNPSTEHWSGVKRILRYLKGTVNYGLCFSLDDMNKLIGFSDSDWAGDLDTRRSTSGYTFHIGRALVSWSSRKQATVAKSSTEAEYVALSIATQEAIWLRRLLSDISFQENSPTLINEDNQGAIELSKNAKHHERTKHIDISFHFIRERVASNEIVVDYCPTNDMIADIMTKPIPRDKFEKFRLLLGVNMID